jgi:hypothetical protein
MARHIRPAGNIVGKQVRKIRTSQGLSQPPSRQFASFQLSMGVITAKTEIFLGKALGPHFNGETGGEIVQARLGLNSGVQLVSGGGLWLGRS